MKITPLIIGTLISTSSFAVEAEEIATCRDHTFAYNKAVFEESENHYFLSLQGSQLNTNEDYSTVFAGIDFANRMLPDQYTITAVFKKNECEIDEGSKTVNCMASSTERDLNRVFVSWTVADLSGPVEVVSPDRAVHIVEARMGPNTQSSITTQLILPRPVLSKLGFYCQEDDMFGHATVSPRLVDYFEGNAEQ